QWQRGGRASGREGRFFLDGQAARCVGDNVFIACSGSALIWGCGVAWSILRALRPPQMGQKSLRRQSKSAQHHSKPLAKESRVGGKSMSRKPTTQERKWHRKMAEGLYN